MLEPRGLRIRKRALVCVGALYWVMVGCGPSSRQIRESSSQRQRSLSRFSKDKGRKRRRRMKRFRWGKRSSTN